MVASARVCILPGLRPAGSCICPSSSCRKNASLPCGKHHFGSRRKTGDVDKWRLVEDFTACYNSLVEIPGIAICLAERSNMVLRCFQDGFLGHVHKYVGFLVTDPVDMLR